VAKENNSECCTINQKGIGQITLKFPKDKVELATFTPARLAKAFRGEL